MRDRVFKKGLVAGIIVLFLGVGFQPAFANEISIPETSDNEDCECQGINRFELFRAKLLLIRLEVFTNILLSKFGHIPEIAEKCQEISNRITTLKVMNLEFKSYLHLSYETFICKLLEFIFDCIFSIYFTIKTIRDKFEDYPIIFNFFEKLLNLFDIPFSIIGFLLFLFHCGEFPLYKMLN